MQPFFHLLFERVLILRRFDRLCEFGELDLATLSLVHIADCAKQSVHINLLDCGLGLRLLFGRLRLLDRRFLGLTDCVNVHSLHVGSGIHVLLERFHAGQIACAIVDGFQVRTDGVAQVVNHALGEVRELAGTGLDMICGHLRTDEEHLGVKAGVKLAQLLLHAFLQLLILVGADNRILRAVCRRSGFLGCGLLFRLLFLTLGVDKAVVELRDAAHHLVLRFL